MARITKIELEQLLAATHEQLRLARERISHLEVELDIRDRRIAAGHELVRGLRKEIAGAAAPVVVIKRMVAPAKPVVTRFYRGGRLVEKTRVGNVASEKYIDEHFVEMDLA